MNLIEEVLHAEHWIHRYIKETPLEYSLALSQMTGCEVFLKLENLQHTGSFKARGAMNKLLALTPEQRAQGVVTASTGNHGAAVAFGLRTLKMQGMVFVPEEASPTKVEAIRRLGAEVRVHGKDSVQTEIFARQYAEQNAMVYVSPYNDPQVIGGQGTIAVELVRQLDRIDAVFVALGGGGMIAGIAGYLKTVFASAKVIACSPQNSCVMIESMKAGRILEINSLPTLSDGTAGGVEPNAITFEPCCRLIDESVLVMEEEIRETMLMFIETHHLLIEGSAAVAVKAFLKTHEQWRGKNVVVVICGGNVSLKTLREILQT
jgi:threonine dehydratase